MTAASPTAKELRAARVAHVLARAVRQDEVSPVDALRILRHEMRGLNRRKSLTLPVRSLNAQNSIDRHGDAGVPPNGSPDSLHSDHIYPFTEDLLRSTLTVDAWVVQLARLRACVCVTAAENYKLQVIERDGTTGPEKYAVAGVTFTTEDLPWLRGD